MKQFKISLNVCAQNLRKWATDYRIWAVFLFVLIVNDMNVGGMIKCAKETGVNCAPWMFAFYNEGYQSKLFYLLPLLLLFGDAPFINSNQPYVIARGKRVPWSIGQVLYIFAASIIYVLVNVVLSVVMLIGHLELTPEWGKLIMAAGKLTIMPDGIWVNQDIIDRYTPFGAMLYSIILNILACTFLGLVIYVVNVLFDKRGYGVLIAMGFILFGGRSFMFNAEYVEDYWVGYICPLAWNTLSALKMNDTMQEPSFTYAVCAYLVLIIGLSVAAVMLSKKQEINVIESV